MHVSDYEALSQEGSSTSHNNASTSSHYADEMEAMSIKPEAYYGEGPFDPPSSDDEADELLEKTGSISLGSAENASRGRDRDGGLLFFGKRPASVRVLVTSLVALVTLAAIIGIFAAHSYTGTPFRIHGTKHITMDHVFNGTFSAKKGGILWVPEAGDGVFATSKDGFLTLVDLKSNTTRHLEHGHILPQSSWKLSADMRYMLLKADTVKLWRHSSYGNYYIHDLQTKATWPLVPPTNPAVTTYATWAPTGQSIAFVMNNDIYVVQSPSPSAAPIRVTTSGNASMFNGVPDWVYEEEVYSGDYALWWSPDSKSIAFLSLDETAVDEFTYPIYNPTENSYAVVPYPEQVTMKYPKPGHSNPLASVYIFRLDQYLANGGNHAQTIATTSFSLDWDGKLDPTNSIISEVVWVGNTTLLVKEVNRAGNNGSVVLFNLASQPKGRGRVVRKLGKDGEQGDNGWIDAEQRVYSIPTNMSPDGHASYLDIVPTPEGYNHIALFSPAASSTPRFLTSGPWEVTGNILAVDVKRRLVYFQAANPHSLQRHIYSVPLPAISSSGKVEPAALTDVSSPGVYSAQFSPKAGFYLLSYNGPQPPWQKVIDVSGQGRDFILTENPQLNDTLAQFEMPVVTRSTIDSDGYELNVIEIRPPRMDNTGRTKYPVLFRVYGGPGSQLVSLDYSHDWHDYLACSLEYVIVIVDGRGTGYKGRKLRNPVKDNLGHWETQDQINAAKIWAAKSYVDPKRIGIWGWSYGGFMSAKVVEANAGIHTLAMAVAPVTSWLLYDSIYTERYMNVPKTNPMGYVTASISNVTGFHHTDFLLAHGSGDDNVHFANSAHLLDMFTREHVRGYTFRMFTDSDHSIQRRGANRELYEYMTAFLLQKWGKGGKRRSW
ncbi:uncharacterized protein FIBRA_03321 [Fibroporia radiculosa]|uniref:Dipeptidyl-peptidase IV n=1 Tax=Fibroporia radiculosa TaxID=599839 RepID=J4HVX5_9APHY|nr:uncharacterized protein FIBRA_03321 [Fibroporia radiculosa]CCM01272.1 predicted protein [Fibroporia radiculosa]